MYIYHGYKSAKMAEYESYLTVTINVDFQIVKKLIGLNMLWENTLATRLTEEYFIIFWAYFCL